jgi:hypothetical protein
MRYSVTALIDFVPMKMVASLSEFTRFVATRRDIHSLNAFNPALSKDLQ